MIASLVYTGRGGTSTDTSPIGSPTRELGVEGCSRTGASEQSFTEKQRESRCSCLSKRAQPKTFTIWASSPEQREWDKSPSQQRGA